MYIAYSQNQCNLQQVQLLTTLAAVETQLDFSSVPATSQYLDFHGADSHKFLVLFCCV